MNITRTTILEENIDDNLWPEFVLAMTYIKNNWPTRAVQNLSSYETYTHKLPDLFQLQVLDSTIYVFLHKKKQMLKSKKWASKALKRTLMDYNGYTIYQIHLKDQKKVIWVKDLCIFEDNKNKFSTKLLDYSKNTPIFQEFLLADNNNK